MFMPLPNAERGEADTVSRVPEPEVARARRRRANAGAWARRFLKLAAALAVLGAGAAAELGSLVALQSSDAVVSAPRIVLRAPIAGVVVAGGPAVGQVVPRGTVLARIDNPRLSRLALAELQARVARIEADLAAGARHRAMLVGFQATLRQRATLHDRVMTERFDAEIAGAEASLAADTARQRQHGRDLARRSVLAATGDLARAQLEQTETALAAATAEDTAQAAARRSLQAQRDAAARGVFAEAGPNEASYATERDDEVALRIAELDQSQAASRADLAQAEAMLQATRADLARAASAAIVAPADAMVWRTGAEPGDVVAPGDTVADLVACDRDVVVAEVPQRDLGEIAIGGAATVRLAGEAADRTGRVLGTLAQAAVADDRRFAIVPAAAGRTPQAMVLVSLGAAPAAAADASGCVVGRSARVVLPRRAHGLLRGLFDRVF